MSTTPIPGVAVGGNRRRRCMTTYTIASLILISTAFPPSSIAAFQHHHSIAGTTTRRFLTDIYTGRRATAASFADTRKLLLHNSRENNDEASHHHDCHNDGDKSMISSVEQQRCRRRNTFGTSSSLAIAIASTQLLFSPLLSSSSMAFAYNYDESDKYASETVTNVVSKLQSSAGDVDATFNTLEEVAKIITEGKGVGGTLTYDGVKLNEGFVADEDTTIYNPGLTLLTSSEKERLVNAIVDNRQISLSTQHWSENNEYAFDFLKQKLDPLHMHELEGYLGILPFYGAALYLVALFVQKNARGIFPLVYGLCALGIFGPVLLLVATGP